MTALIHFLIALFPPSFRDQFGDDMLELYRDQLHGAASQGRLAVLRLNLRTVLGMTGAALRERWTSRHEPRVRRPWFANSGRDLRLAFRTLRKSPMFALVAVLCISLGSGAVTTIFSTMNALIFRPLPGTSDSERLVRIERKKPNEQDGTSASYPLYEQVRDRSRTLSDVVAWGKASLVIRSGEQAGTEVYGNLVSGNLFSVFGVKPLVGRFFTTDEDATELTHPVIVVSEGFWRTQLAASRDAIGKPLLVNGHPFTLIGVAPSAFQGMDSPIKVDAYAPIHMQRWLRTTPGPLTDPQGIWLRLGGRLAPGATMQAAHAELSGIATAIGASATEPKWMAPYTDMRVHQLTGLPPDATDTLGGFLGLLLGAAALVLIIASVNVAALLSARVVARQREMAVRAALGASRTRLARQLLTEVLVLFTIGALGGAAVAWVATSALERIPIPSDLPFSLVLVPDMRVLAFALVVALATGLIVGLAPIRQAVRTDVEGQLRNGSGGGTARRSLAGNALIVAQLAVSLVLLVGAGLFVRALDRAGEVEKGFETEGVVTVPLDTESWGYDEAQGQRFYADLTRAVAQLPSVTSTSYTTVMPLNFQRSGTDIELPGSDQQGGIPVQQMIVDPGYFDVLRIPLSSGRGFGSNDVTGSARVAVVNQTMARRFWTDGEALGRTFRMGGQDVTIVGVARDAKYSSLDEATPPMAYFPLQQDYRARRKLVVRTSSDPLAFAPLLRDAIHQVDPNAPRVVVTTLTEATGLGLIPQRVAAMVTGVLGVVGLILSMAGLYGVVSYSAAQRTREIGIRMALGAEARDVLRMMLSEGVRLIVPGVIVGLLLAAGLTRLMTSLLLGVSPLDPGTYLVMPLSLILVALLASYLPARRAANADPAGVLRSD